MGGWCDNPGAASAGPDATIVYTPFLRDVLAQCVAEFARHTKRPLAEGAASTFVSIFERTVAVGLTSGERWTPLSRAFVLHYIALLGREAERLAAATSEHSISSAHVEEAVTIAIERGRRVERRLSA
jgi:hypothetical protein